MMLWHTYEVPGLYLSALCCWREAEGEGRDGWRGVLHVIKNREMHPSWYGKTLAEVVLAPKQFSSFNKDNPRATEFPKEDDANWQQILTLAERVTIGQDEDLTDGALYYHTLDCHPDWDKTLTQTAIIGRHVFFK